MRSPRSSIEPLVTSPRSPSSRLEMARSVVVLPAPLPPEQGDDAAFGHLQRHALEHQDHVVVDDLDAVDVENDVGCGHGLSSPIERHAAFRLAARREPPRLPSPGGREGPSAAAGWRQCRSGLAVRRVRRCIFLSARYLSAPALTIGLRICSSAWYQSLREVPLAAVPGVDARPGRAHVVGAAGATAGASRRRSPARRASSGRAPGSPGPSAPARRS